jgi:hypothetical protein
MVIPVRQAFDRDTGTEQAGDQQVARHPEWRLSQERVNDAVETPLVQPGSAIRSGVDFPDSFAESIF